MVCAAVGGSRPRTPLPRLRRAETPTRYGLRHLCSTGPHDDVGPRALAKHSARATLFDGIRVLVETSTRNHKLVRRDLTRPEADPAARTHGPYSGDDRGGSVPFRAACRREKPSWAFRSVSNRTGPNVWSRWPRNTARRRKCWMSETPSDGGCTATAPQTPLSIRAKGARGRM